MSNSVKAIFIFITVNTWTHRGQPRNSDCHTLTYVSRPEASIRQ